MPDPSRGQVWYVNFNPIRGHEPAGRRPALVVSTDRFNQSRADLAIVLPITSKQKGIPWQVEVNPPEGGLRERSFIQCEAVRCVSKERLSDRLGVVSSTIMKEVEDRLYLLLELPTP